MKVVFGGGQREVKARVEQGLSSTLRLPCSVGPKIENSSLAKELCQLGCVNQGGNVTKSSWLVSPHKENK